MTIEDEFAFFKILTKKNNKSQQIALLKSITNVQYDILQNIALDVLEGIIILTDKEYNILSKYKHFIRKLSKVKVGIRTLTANLIPICLLCEIFLTLNDVHEEISVSSTRRMGKTESEKQHIKNRSGGSSTSKSTQEYQSEGDQGNEEEEEDEDEESNSDEVWEEYWNEGKNADKYEQYHEDENEKFEKKL